MLMRSFPTIGAVRISQNKELRLRTTVPFAFFLLMLSGLFCFIVSGSPDALAGTLSPHTTSPTTTMPRFSIPEGTYTLPQTVKISVATTGATIYYTQDGHTPTTSSPRYTGPITVSSSATIMALATSRVGKTSPVTTAVYKIKQIIPTLGMSSSSSTITYGQSVTITATLSVNLTGTVSMRDGSALICSKIVNNSSTSTCTTSTLTAGSHPVTAVYAGSPNSTPVISSPIVQVVKPASQIITFIVPTTQVSYGTSPIKLVATASSGLGVSFSVKSGPATVNGNILTISDAGSVVVAATQNGNNNYMTAAPVSQTLLIKPLIPTITAITLGTATYGSPVTMTVTGINLSNIKSAMVNGISASSVVPVSSTQATITYVPCSVISGQSTITVASSGGTSIPFTFMLSPALASTTTTLKSSLNPIYFGQPVTLSAAITAGTSCGTPTGTVTFTQTSALGTSTLDSGGSTSLSNTTSYVVAPGNKDVPFSANYVSNGIYKSSNARIGVPVVAAPTTTTVTLSSTSDRITPLNSSYQGSPFFVIIQVASMATSVPNPNIANGGVTCNVENGGNTVIGTWSRPNANGQITWKVNDQSFQLSAGTNKIACTYSGYTYGNAQQFYQSSASASINAVVSTIPPPTFSLPSGSYSSAQMVTISDLDSSIYSSAANGSIANTSQIPNTTIYCTSTPSLPMSQWPACTGSVKVSGSETLYAYAKSNADMGSLSAISSASYVISSADGIYQVSSMPLSFTLTQPGTEMSDPLAPVVTSAGAYNDKGVLISTLWSAQMYFQDNAPYQLNSGSTNLFAYNTPYTVYYTGMFCKTCTIRVLSSQIAYHWDGVIGNTSANATGSTTGISTNCSATSTFVSPFCWLNTETPEPTASQNDTNIYPLSNPLGYPVSNGSAFTLAYQWGDFASSAVGVTQLRFAFAGHTGWAANGYAEGGYNLAAFNDQTPNNPLVPVLQILPSGLGSVDSSAADTIMYTAVTTDNANVYLANAGNWGGDSYVAGYAAQSVGSSSGPLQYSWPITSNNFTLGSGWGATWYSFTNSTIGQIHAPNEFPNGVTGQPVLDYGPQCNGQYGLTGTKIESVLKTQALAPNSNAFYALPGSIAVQYSGNVLAVGHNASNCAFTYTDKNGNLISDTIAIPIGTIAIGNSASSLPSIKLFDKKSGVTLGSVPYSAISSITSTGFNPEQMAFSSQGLWVLNQSLDSAPGPKDAANNSYLRYLDAVNEPNQLIFIPFTGSTPGTAQVFTYSGESNPVAIAVGKGSTNHDHLYVLDGGTNQQMYEFLPGASTYANTYGIKSGYNNAVEATTNRLMLDNYAASGEYSSNSSAIAVEDDGDVWITDAGNIRVLHLSTAPNCSPQQDENTYCYVDHISHLRPNYHVTIDLNDPSRIFVGMLEYHVDTSQPLTPGDPSQSSNPSWSLVNNWTSGLKQIVSASNGGKAVYFNLFGRASFNQVWDNTQTQNGTSTTTTYAIIGTENSTADGTLLYTLPCTISQTTGTKTCSPIRAHAASGAAWNPHAHSLSVTDNGVGSDSYGSISYLAIKKNNSASFGPYGVSIAACRQPSTVKYSSDSYYLEVCSQSVLYGEEGASWAALPSGLPIEYNPIVTPSPSGGWGMGINVTPTMNNVLPIYQATEGSQYIQGFPHFAGVNLNPGSNYGQYQFQVMPETCLASYAQGQTGFFPFAGRAVNIYGAQDIICNQGTTKQDSFGGHDGSGTWTVNLPLYNPATTTNTPQTLTTPSYGTFFVGYDGQNATYGDQFLHYNDDGLLIGQFGNTGFYDLQKGAGGVELAPDGEDVPLWLAEQPIEGVAKNVAQFQVASGTANDPTGNIYLYHTDESRMAGIHRWSVWNTNSITELAVNQQCTPTVVTNCYANAQ